MSEEVCVSTKISVVSTQRHTVPDSNFVEIPVPTWEHTSRPFETLEKSVEYGKSAQLDRDHNFFKPRVLEREKAVRKLLTKTYSRGIRALMFYDVLPGKGFFLETHRGFLKHVYDYYGRVQTRSEKLVF